MPYLLDSGSAQGGQPPLLRKFSWETDYDETQVNLDTQHNAWTLEGVYGPAETRTGAQKSNSKSQFNPRSGSNERKIRRKPVSIDRGSISSSSSNFSNSNASIASTTPPSSRASSVCPLPDQESQPLSPPPPNRAPPPPPIQSSQEILSRDIRHKSQPLPPAPLASVPPEVPQRDAIPLRHKFQELAVRTQARLSITPPSNSFNGERPEPKKTRPPPVPAKLPLPPRSPHGGYTAMLDFGLPSPKTIEKYGAQTRPKLVSPKDKRKSQPNFHFSLPIAAARDPANTPKRYRRTSLSPIISPPVTSRKSSLKSPDTPVAKPLTAWTKDPTYTAGYESDPEVPEVPAEPSTTPSYRPPTSSRSDKPLPPRINTDLPPVTPLRIVQRSIVIPKEGLDKLPSAKLQTEELNEIVDRYLDELIADATARGVMSVELSDYLTKLGSDEQEQEEQQIPMTLPLESGRKKSVRFVSLVRRALRQDVD